MIKFIKQLLCKHENNVVLAGWDYEGYTDIGMKVFANIDDANKYAKEMLS